MKLTLSQLSKWGWGKLVTYHIRTRQKVATEGCRGDELHELEVGDVAELALDVEGGAGLEKGAADGAVTQLGQQQFQEVGLRHAHHPVRDHHDACTMERVDIDRQIDTLFLTPSQP